VTDDPVWAAAPGQAAVLYDGEVTLGGGRIARDAATGQAAARSAASAQPLDAGVPARQPAGARS
jgi:hypothetical protein